MSYILDSLKKLEQEKAEQSQQSDFKSLLLKTEHSEQEIRGLKNRVRFLWSLAFGVCLLALVSGLGYHRYFNQEKSFSSPSSEKETTETALPSPSQETIKPGKKINKDDRVAAEEKTLEKKSDITPEFLIQSPEEKADAEVMVRKKQKVLLEEALLRKATEEDFQEIDMPRPFQPFPSAADEALVDSFPRFDIKAVIFFGVGNAANYIIVRDGGGNRIKLKKGEKFNKVTVADILPQKAHFLFGGNLFEKEMGKE